MPSIIAAPLTRHRRARPAARLCPSPDLRWPPHAPMAEECGRSMPSSSGAWHPKVALIDQIANYIVSAGGKRIRPHARAAVLRRARLRRAASASSWPPIVEFIHTATLLHDDVVDESALRRGRRTANALFGNAASVLVGDFVYSRAFQMMVSVGPHARAGGARRRDQRDRRGRSAAADEHARPRRRASTTTCASSATRPPSCSRPARGSARSSREADDAIEEALRRLRPLTRHRLPAGRRPARLRRRTPSNSARTSATTCARASRRCRC